jgi:hypothetical protein
MNDPNTGDTRASDTRPKRAGRQPVQGHAAPGEAVLTEVVAAATEAVIERNLAPEPVSTIALARAVPSGPACPVPAAPEGSPAETAAFVSNKSPEAVPETAWTVFAEAQAALARGFEKAAIELSDISRSGIAATADAAVALLGARTLAEALEINAALVRRGLDTAFEASTRLSEIGANAVADASRPLLSGYGRGWDALGTG